MFGKNIILAPENHAGEYLMVKEIFKTIQGEGPLVGYPAIFLRLGGCNLACDFCDTDFDNYEKFSLAQIIGKIENLSINSSGKKTVNLVVITGGEPMRQPIEKLCDQLIKHNYKVQIETNGTLYRQLPSEVMIICSPKVTNHKYHAIRADLLSHINYFKFIISANNPDYFEVSEVGQSVAQIPVYIQPMDEYDALKNQRNLQRSIDLALQHGYFLSSQAHKIWGLK